MISRSDAYAQINASLDLHDIMARCGIDMGRDSKNILCPFHSEKTPSMHVWRDHFYCFGCGAHGDIIGFIARWYNLSPHDALKRLCSDYGLDAQPDEAYLKYTLERDLRKKLDAWINRVYIDICDTLWILRGWCNNGIVPPDNRYWLIAQYYDYLDYVADSIINGETTSIYKGKEYIYGIIKLIRRADSAGDQRADRAG